MKSHDVTIQLKAAELYFPVVLCWSRGRVWEMLTNTPKMLFVTKGFLKSYSGLSMQYASSS